MDYKPDENTLRIAFDADAVVFLDDSEQIYKSVGLKEFRENESKYEDVLLKEDPFMKFIKLIAKIQRALDKGLIRIAIVATRDYFVNLRVIKTLRKWGVYVYEAFFFVEYLKIMF